MSDEPVDRPAMSPLSPGRRPHFDARSRDYDIAAILGGATRAIRRGWAVPKVLDQLKGRHTIRDQMGCCGFAVAHELVADPVRVGVDNGSGYSLYLGAKQRDPWPDDQGGTALIYAIQEAQARGYYTSYRWAFNAGDLIAALAHEGPVILGSAWLRGMDEPTRQGVVHPTGPVLGGHAYLARGYDLHKRFRIGHNRYTKRRAYLACLNSLGRRYGVQGRFWLPLDEWEGVLMHHPHQAAEMCVPVGRRRP